MKYFICLLLSFISLDGLNAQYSSVKKVDSGSIFFIGPATWTTYDNKSGKVTDSFTENQYYIFNSKKIPPKGLYIDSVVWVDAYGKFYIIAAFMNQQRVLYVDQYVRKGSVNTPDIFIDKKFKLKK